MSNPDGRCGRELRRLLLAARMIALNARTHTIRYWTGLSKPRIHEAVRDYWSAHATVARNRASGPMPKALKSFWQSRSMHREAATLAGLSRHFGVLPAQAACEGTFAGLTVGERMCAAYELYASFITPPRISLEQAQLLLDALAKGVNVELARCPECATLVLIDRQNTAKPRCTYCKG